MKKLSLALPLIVSLLFSISAAAQETTPSPVAPETVVSLDPILVTALGKRFPGYRLASQKDYHDSFNGNLCPAGPGYQWSYGALKADFNGDGRDDYTLIIRYKRFFLFLTALRQGNSYKIKNFGPAVVLGEDDPPVRRQSGMGLLLTIGPPGGLKRDETPLNPFPYIHLIGDGDCIEAYWKDGVWTADSFID